MSTKLTNYFFTIKRIIYLGISLAFWIISEISNKIKKLMGMRPSAILTILYYHSIRPEMQKKFAKQMDDLIRFTKPIRADAENIPFDGYKYTAITFDDGFYSVVKYALPELEKRGIPVMLFIPTGFLGNYPLWLKDSTHEDKQETILTGEQLRELSSHNLVTIGSHTVTHKRLTELSEADILIELQHSRENLESLLEKTIKSISFPNGKYSRNIAETAQKIGYKFGFTVDPFVVTPNSDSFLRGRFHASPHDWRLEYILKLQGAYRWQKYIFAIKNFLPLMNRNLKTEDTK